MARHSPAPSRSPSSRCWPSPALPPLPPATPAAARLLTQSQDSVRAKGSFGIDVAFRTMAYDRYVGRGDAASALVDFENGRLVGGHHRDANMDHELLQIDVSYGLTQKLTLIGALPLLNRRSHGHFEYRPEDAEGPVEHEHGPPPPGWVLADEPIYHRKSGLGDIQLGASYAALWSVRESLVARATIELPTGDYRATEAWGYIDRPDVQAGSGSTDLIGSLQYQRGIGTSGFGLLAAGMYRLNGENPLGYRFGDDARSASASPAPRGRAFAGRRSSPGASWARTRTSAGPCPPLVSRR